MLCLVPPPPKKGQTPTTGLSITLAFSKTYSSMKRMCHLCWIMSRKKTTQLWEVICLSVDVRLSVKTVYPTMSRPPPPLPFLFWIFHSEHLFYNIQANIYVISWKGTAGNVIISLCRCFFDPLHPFLGHRGDAIVLHGTCLGPVQPWRGSYSLENMPRL